MQFDIYSGAYLASKYGVIVMAIGYRLSVWGWLALDKQHGGNYGEAGHSCARVVAAVKG